MRYVAILFFALLGLPAYAVQPVFVDQFIWSSDRDGFGGFSGLDIGPKGRNFTTVSDHGKILTGAFERKNGAISSVKIKDFVPLLDLHGHPVVKYNTDSEGLVVTASGTIYVSFEGNHRVWRYENIKAKAEKTANHPDFKKMQNNSSLESLAIDATGALYTMPERSGDLARPFPVYRFNGKKWEQPFKIPRRDRFLPVGSDFGPDGKFYLLERDFIWYKGFATRIRRFDLTPAGFANEETLLKTSFGTYDNLEGIATWTDQAGRIRLTMVSDDNFSMLQTTEFVEYALPPVPTPTAKPDINP